MISENSPINHPTLTHRYTQRKRGKRTDGRRGGGGEVRGEGEKEGKEQWVKVRKPNLFEFVVTTHGVGYTKPKRFCLVATQT